LIRKREQLAQRAQEERAAHQEASQITGVRGKHELIGEISTSRRKKDWRLGKDTVADRLGFPDTVRRKRAEAKLAQSLSKGEPFPKGRGGRLGFLQREGSPLTKKDLERRLLKVSALEKRKSFRMRCGEKNTNWETSRTLETAGWRKGHRPEKNAGAQQVQQRLLKKGKGR